MAKDPVLYVIACGGRPAADLPPFIERLQSDGWTVCVVSTPSGMKFLDAGRLAEFETPKAWRFVDALPRGATGKVLRRLLREGA